MATTDAAGPADQQILDAIHERLVRDVRTEPDQVQVDVVDGQVTLAGTVDNHDARDRAEAAIREVPGVTYVLNNLRVAQAGTTGATG
jgi:osmotically-inducible protein OsmY